MLNQNDLRWVISILAEYIDWKKRESANLNYPRLEQIQTQLEAQLNDSKG